MTHWVCVLVQTPAHAKLGSVLSYRSESALPPGTLVRVPLGKRETLGIVWDAQSAHATGEFDPEKIRSVVGMLDGIAPLGSTWQQLVTFAAQYYQRSLGEVALAALPPQIRELSPLQVQRRLKRNKPAPVIHRCANDSLHPCAGTVPELSEEQSAVIQQITTQPGPFLLFGATGSGKTEVYLHCVQTLLTSSTHAQALIMVPEINLTPQ
ncbi:MAG: DEAD/DEAH box helicase family protein, partial [Rhodoferax sp.]|nr:DEAD/DEAH box helicase family protein [Rhodoferax sp.]